MKRSVFFISDGTGITAETLGHSLLTQFDKVQFEPITIPYIDTLEKAKSTVAQINSCAKKEGVRPIIFSTLVNPKTRSLVEKSDGLFLDFFKTFLVSLEKELNIAPTPHIGRMHGLVDYKSYMMRIEAVNYALNHDDGLRPQNYDKSDLILVGVSRCGKTPTCLYLALQFGLFAANYPFTEDDINNANLPTGLLPYKSKLFGLSINPKRLHLIRQERRPNSRYSSLEQCQLEVRKAEDFFKSNNIPFLSTTTRSIEEIATSLIATLGIKRRLGDVEHH